MAHFGLIAMDRYLPVFVYLLAALAVLCIAGLGAAGSVRGMVRYLRMWFVQVALLVLVALLGALLLNGIT